MREHNSQNENTKESLGLPRTLSIRHIEGMSRGRKANPIVGRIVNGIEALEEGHSVDKVHSIASKFTELRLRY